MTEPLPLVERLRAAGDHHGLALCHEAADRFEALEAEVALMTVALMTIANMGYGGAPDIAMRKIARAALEGKPA